jgi:serine/threonine protein kinase
MVPEPMPLDGASQQSADELARLLRAMHDRGVSHRDLKSANIVLARGTDPVLIDLVGVDTRARITDALRARELGRLNVSFLGIPAVTRTIRLRFLRTYIGARAALRADWKCWWKMIFRATTAKVAKNRRNGRTIG